MPKLYYLPSSTSPEFHLKNLLCTRYYRAGTRRRLRSILIENKKVFALNDIWYSSVLLIAYKISKP